jgi:L-threonylcarbamoyladenylate synthase
VAEPPNRITERLSDDTAGIARAAALLRAGRLVAFPTETVYGLGADATDGRAVADIYEAKGRPRFNPLIAHVATPDAAFALGRFEKEARALAEAFWPGPLTLVVPALPDCPISDLARAGLGSVAIRVPAHRTAQAVLSAAGRPIAAPSANLSGHVSPTSASHVLDDLDGRIDAVLDGDGVDVGVESTIIACLDGALALLRPGGLERAEIERVIGRALPGSAAERTQSPIAPGMLASHYAPQARLRLDVVDIQPGEACLAFGTPPAGADPSRIYNLSASSDLREASQRLFGGLRWLDRFGTETIAVSPIPSEGLGEAIRDRLERAAAPRDL